MRPPNLFSLSNLAVGQNGTGKSNFFKGQPPPFTRPPNKPPPTAQYSDTPQGVTLNILVPQPHPGLGPSTHSAFLSAIRFILGDILSTSNSQDKQKLLHVSSPSNPLRPSRTLHLIFFSRLSTAPPFAVSRSRKLVLMHDIALLAGRNGSQHEFGLC